MKRVGLLGGTFDPPHTGHLLIAEEVRQALQLDEVWFIPSYQPPHKRHSGTQAELRMKMVEAAIEGNQYFSVNPVEVVREGKSYTVDTIRLLQKHHPDVEFYFIIGADMVEYLSKWHRIDELVELVQFVGVKRSHYPLETSYPVIEAEIPGMDVSSTLIRERIAAGISVRYLVPDSVINKIKEHQLYGAE
ncbi:nicotinate-nucleotide adenylyltransferase [Sediminibacillus albus]|uniref:Probable nicotinate-nucleotide adenylyltransferase n=1 Tax=Sediminibacillus albus TaxID=407036 RepID=A0A1G9CMI1_9BACI|nr:nicotinate-nucleotide adenylyltransferase [Sediminibacillus albus]SDK52838.1 nicotinate-nucleotide adenylyltransferase [Sediminibacillus albus]